MAKRNGPTTTAKRPRQAIELPTDLIEVTRRLALGVLNMNDGTPPDRAAITGGPGFGGFIVTQASPAVKRLIAAGHSAKELIESGMKWDTAKDRRVGHKNRQTRAAREALATIAGIERDQKSGDVAKLLRDCFALGGLLIAMQFFGDDEHAAEIGKEQLKKPKTARDAKGKRTAKRHAEFERRVRAKMNGISLTDAAQQVEKDAKGAHETGFSLSVFNKHVRKRFSKS